MKYFLNLIAQSSIKRAMRSKQFRKALEQEKPLQIVGVINAYVALMAKETGYRALYLSGAGVANMSFGIPDEGMTALEHVLEDAGRITSTVDLPLLVDIDTGWQIEKTIPAMEKVGVAAVHIEDQVDAKKCGHLEGKKLVSQEEMCERIQAAVQARKDPNFMIMARTDAYAVEGMDKTIERALAYQKAGADMLFPEALDSLEAFQSFKRAIDVPVLANLTEFGKTPMFSTKELSTINIDMALYPLSVTRAMNLAALKALQDIRKNGSQQNSVQYMQTREELYQFLKTREIP